ncbi:MAG: type I DNA topoisomerase [Chlorobi bacterium]|nr:type I DNA topoisomerase [Chlorobiota bacterium]
MSGRDLLIVESPTKARTISRFLGDRFVVESSQGHVRDLPEKDDNAVDVQNGFTPRYVLIPGKKKVIERLSKLASDAPAVLLATDEDREGEAIAWHLAEALGLDPQKTRRIVFHEITRSAIERALANPRGINEHLVNAQQARRILDRLVGYELSPLLWRKVKGALSAGRVQSVAVRLIVEREREIEAFVPQSSYRVQARFRTDGDELVRAELSERIAAADHVQQLLERLVGARYTVDALETKPGKKSPPAPFTTSTLQQESARRLGLSITKTMQLAQQLYEQGYITYMRTDSVTLSEEALDAAAAVINQLYGQEYHQRRQYQTKVANAQEAHEAIRPTDFSRRTLDNTELGEQAQRLYELIWKRALASQMKDAQLERTIATIAPSTVEQRFIAEGEVVTFDGFLRLYTIERDDDTESEDPESALLPLLRVGQDLSADLITARQTFTRPPARYNEATLVRKLEELGIGRPSTYATIVARIQERDYVERRTKSGTERPVHILRLEGGIISQVTETETVGSERNKLFPTQVGVFVTDFLAEHFPDVMDYQFTAQVEEQFDQIARGELQWQRMLESFYVPFHAKVEHVRESAQKVGRRHLGTDPSTGEDVFVGINRNKQPYVQRGDRFASLPVDILLEHVTLEQALYYLQFPRVLGEYNGGTVSIAMGRGAYIEWRADQNRQFVNIPPDRDPLYLTLEEAIELLQQSEHERGERHNRMYQPRTIGTTDDGREVAVGIGRYGPYVRIGDKFVTIPKDRLDSITVEEALSELSSKQRQTEQRILRRFEENPNAMIMQGKTKPYLKVDSRLYWLPDGFDYEHATLEECLAQATLAPRTRKSSTKRR